MQGDMDNYGTATHIWCDQCQQTVPLAFGGFSLLDAKDEAMVGGDLMCSQCHYVIATVSRSARDSEIAKLRGQ